MGRTIKNVTGEHRRVALLRAQGKTQKEIAEETGYSISHVRQVLANPQIKSMIESEGLLVRQGEAKGVDEVFKRASPKAAQLLEQIITDSDTLGDHAPTLKDRMSAAIELLERAGYGKNVKVQHMHGTLKPEDFKEIMQRGERFKNMQVAEVIESGPLDEAIDIDAESREAV